MYVIITNAEGKPLLQRNTRSPEPERDLTISRGANRLYSLSIDADGSVTVGRWDKRGIWRPLHTTPAPGQEKPST